MCDYMENLKRYRELMGLSSGHIAAHKRIGSGYGLVVAHRNASDGVWEFSMGMADDMQDVNRCTASGHVVESYPFTTMWSMAEFHVFMKLVLDVIGRIPMNADNNFSFMMSWKVDGEHVQSAHLFNASLEVLKMYGYRIEDVYSLRDKIRDFLSAKEPGTRKVCISV